MSIKINSSSSAWIEASFPWTKKKLLWYYTHSHLYITGSTLEGSTSRANRGSNNINHSRRKPKPKYVLSKQIQYFLTLGLYRNSKNKYAFISVHHNHLMRRFTSRGRKFKRDAFLRTTCNILNEFNKDCRPRSTRLCPHSHGFSFYLSANPKIRVSNNVHILIFFFFMHFF